MPNACDACSVRKVRCDGHRPCMNCINNKLDCTNKRPRGKPGPKRIRSKTIKAIQSIKGNETLSTNYFLFEKVFMECLQVYENKFYSIWPVIHPTLLQDVLMEHPTNIKLKDPSLYALVCAVCAVISKRMRMPDYTGDTLGDLDTEFVEKMFLKEVDEFKSSSDIQIEECSTSILTSFFLYEYYLTTENGYHRALVYLREAITIIQLLFLQEEKTYQVFLKEEGYQMRKIYYLIYTTEFYFYVKHRIPRLLQEDVSLPKFDESCPNEDEGFIVLTEIFSICGSLFGNTSLKEHDSHDNIFDAEELFSYESHGSLTIQNNLTNQVVQALEKLQKLNLQLSHYPIQAVNILVSLHWARTLIWKKFNGINPNDSMRYSCLSRYYPVEIAHDFLSELLKLPDMLYLSEGGSYMKILDLMDSLTTVVGNNEVHETRFIEKIAREYFASLFNLILRIRRTHVIPARLLNNAIVLCKMSVPSLLKAPNNHEVANRNVNKENS